MEIKFTFLPVCINNFGIGPGQHLNDDALTDCKWRSNNIHKERERGGGGLKRTTFISKMQSIHFHIPLIPNLSTLLKSPLLNVIFDSVGFEGALIGSAVGLAVADVGSPVEGSFVGFAVEGVG